MAIIEAGQPAPDFSLATYEGDRVHPGGPAGPDHGPGLLPVRVLAGLHRPAERLPGGARGPRASAARRSTASPATPSGPSRRSARSSASTIEQLSDFEPKGAACRAFGVLHPGGFPERALVMTGPDGVVLWSHQADSPGDLPGANLIFDALDAAAV